jgi:hypothetical protein
MKFKQAVENTADVSGSYQIGLQALERKDRVRIKCDNTRVIAGSIHLDHALRDAHPQESRWDYGIGIEIDIKHDRVIWLEVHPASTSTIDTVVAKHRWLKQWLEKSAQALQKMPSRFVWVASGKVAVAQHARQVKRLASLGIIFAGSRYKIRGT